MKHLLNIDRLELNMTQNENPVVDLFSSPVRNEGVKYIPVNEQFILERDDTRVHYARQYNIHLNSQVVGKLKLNPYVHPSSDIINLKILNKGLYSDLYTILSLINKPLSLNYHSVSRIDIAMDSQINYVQRIIDTLLDPEMILVSGNRVISKIDSICEIHRTGDRTDSIYFGSSKSDYRVCVYNKSRENLSSGKEYITDIYKSEFESPDDVYRMEVRLRGRAFKKYRSVGNKTEVQQISFNLDRLKDTEYLTSLFMFFFTNLIDFRRKSSANITRCEKVPILDLDSIEIPQIKPVKFLYERRNEDYTLRKRFMIHRIKQYQLYPTVKNYDDCIIFFEKFIATEALLTEWCHDYARKERIMLIPPKGHQDYHPSFEELFGDLGDIYPFAGTKNKLKLWTTNN